MRQLLSRRQGVARITGSFSLPESMMTDFSFKARKDPSWGTGPGLHSTLRMLELAYRGNYLEDDADNEPCPADPNHQRVAMALRMDLLPIEFWRETFDVHISGEVEAPAAARDKASEDRRTIENLNYSERQELLWQLRGMLAGAKVLPDGRREKNDSGGSHWGVLAFQYDPSTGETQYKGANMHQWFVSEMLATDMMPRKLLGSVFRDIEIFGITTPVALIDREIAEDVSVLHGDPSFEEKATAAFESATGLIVVRGESNGVSRHYREVSGQLAREKIEREETRKRLEQEEAVFCRPTIWEDVMPEIPDDVFNSERLILERMSDDERDEFHHNLRELLRKYDNSLYRQQVHVRGLAWHPDSNSFAVSPHNDFGGAYRARLQLFKELEAKGVTYYWSERDIRDRVPREEREGVLPVLLGVLIFDCDPRITSPILLLDAPHLLESRTDLVEKLADGKRFIPYLGTWADNVGREWEVFKFH